MLNTNITFRINKEVKQALKLILKKENKTMSSLLRDYIKKLYKKMGIEYEI